MRLLATRPPESPQGATTVIETALFCRGVVKRYEDVLALDGLDLEVARGECFGLLGPNGAGKTTTVEILEGLLAPDAGEVRVLGQTWGHDEHALRQRLGIALQETFFPEKLTCLEVLRLFRSFYARGYEAQEALELVGLQEKGGAWTKKLSGGQRQRLSLACALVGKPDVLFLDEPTTGLDPQSRRKIWEIVADFRDSGGTILLTTHYMEEAQRLCERVAVIDRGRVIALGTPRELIARLGAEHVVEVRVEGAWDANAAGALPGVRSVTQQDGVARLNVSRLHEAVPALMGTLAAAGLTLSELSTHEATLEDVFVALTGRHLRDE